MMRFCTSLSANTTIASTRSLSTGTKSMRRNANCSRRGTLTTPTKCVIAESSSEALPSSACVPEPGGSSLRRRTSSPSGSGLSCSSESTNSR